MQDRYFWIILVIVIFIPILLVSLSVPFEGYFAQFTKLYVGVDAAYDNLQEIKMFVDDASSYTNTIILGSSGITHNFTKLDDACQYIYDKGMYFMIYAHPIDDPGELLTQCQWTINAKPRWGDQFLGLYAYDEPGGRQLDNAPLKVVMNENWFADNYTAAADKYVSELTLILNHTIDDQMCGAGLPLFTSDYALYWFDYKSEYDTVFAEFGWNYSRQLNIALCRGAANVQNKDWGVMITWTYTQWPYLESGSELYNDMVLAYENGAKYIIIFDTNKNYTHSVLDKDEEGNYQAQGHYDALKQFWQYVKDNPRSSDPIRNRVAYVLPEGYGYGFRGPEDKIWGLWSADDFSFRISTELGKLFDRYQNTLDVIYDDGLEADNPYGYRRLIFWNGTVWKP
ncbi:hypothetical protein E2P61_02510 [Candidatus Bathyarchaeota archaeon]|nr:hypothetical protein E2P61_02510 [Candidatus Bathyarchaeota archaeon]